MLAAGEVQDRRPSVSPPLKGSVGQDVVVDGKAKDLQEPCLAVNDMPVPAATNSSANAPGSERPAPAHSPTDTEKGAPKKDEKVMWEGKEVVLPKAVSAILRQEICASADFADEG